MPSRKLSPNKMLVILLLQQCVFAAVGAWWFLTKGLVSPTQLAVNMRSVLLGLLLTGTLVGLAIGAGRWLPTYMQNLNETITTLWREMGVKLTPLAVVLLSVGAGIGEEFVFRGALQSALIPLASPWGAIAIASLLFGALHAVNKAYFLATTVIGIVLGVAYYLSDSLVAVVIAHMLYDIWALNQLAHLLGQRH